jgi:hypothetical protein
MDRVYGAGNVVWKFCATSSERNLMEQNPSCGTTARGHNPRRTSATLNQDVIIVLPLTATGAVGASGKSHRPLPGSLGLTCGEWLW